MFRWCAYCQRLIGEREPLAEYALTHGVCDACIESFSEELAPQTIHAAEVFAGLNRAGVRGDLRACEPLIARGAELGLRSSDILIGVVHPALIAIGEQWEREEITVADEHRFTALCSRFMALLPRPAAPPSNAPGVILAVGQDNSHDLGVRMLELVTEERGLRCTAIYPGLPDAELVSLVQSERPALAGISVAMPDMVPAAVLLARELASLGPTPPRVVLGGVAFRGRTPVTAPPDVEVVRTIDEYLELLRQVGGAWVERP